MSKKTYSIASLAGFVGIFGLTACSAAPADTGTEFGEATQELSGYLGCRGAGNLLCDELVDPFYYQYHTECLRNRTCEGGRNGQYGTCDSRCPAPVGDEIPNVMVKASGDESPGVSLIIGYTYSHSHGGGLWSSDVPSGSTWKELKIGAGVHTPDGKDTLVICNIGSIQYHKVTGMRVVYNNGSVQDHPCDEGGCNLSIPTDGGFVATCNYAKR